MEDIIKLVPRTPPEGFLDWEPVKNQTDVHGLIYEAVWVEDRSLENLITDRVRKVKKVRVKCSFCGTEELLDWCGTDICGNSYGFIHPLEAEPVRSGDATLCPFCRRCAVAVKAAETRVKGYAVTTYETFMSASVVGKANYLTLTGWRVERRVDREAHESLAALPYEAYVFGQGTECAKLTGWCNSYSGTAGYFHALLHEWRQPQRWSESWGAENEIYNLTSELVEGSSLPNCKLCEYMSSWHNFSEKYPVPYLRLYQWHPNVEVLLLHGLPRVLDDLLHKELHGFWGKNVQGLPVLDGIRWEEKKPARMLGLSREELRRGRKAAWGATLWEIFVGAKETGEILTEEDMTNLFYLGDEKIIDLVGTAPVGKSVRYLLKQCEVVGPGLEYEDGTPAWDGSLDAPMLMDYWRMCQMVGRSLDDPTVRWPANLLYAHDSVSELAQMMEQENLDAEFRKRRKHLSKYIFEADGYVIFPAGRQADLQRESDVLEHCVWSYGKRHARGELSIFFIRRSISPHEPYFTLNFNEERCSITENRGLRNCDPPVKVKAFAELWISWVRAGSKRDKDGNPILPKQKGKGVA